MVTASRGAMGSYRRLVVVGLAAALLTAGCAQGAQVRVAVAGDVWLRGGTGATSPLHYVAPLLRSADVAILNLEGPLTQRSETTPNKSRADLAARVQFILKGSPAAAGCLPQAGVDAVTLANNHMMDYRAGGCSDTRARLAQLGVACTGAGPNDAVARRPAVAGRSGARVAVLSYLAFMTAGGLGACTPATPSSAGVAVLRAGANGLSAGSREALRRDIVAARRQAPIVLVALHWGVQKADRPTSYQRTLARTALALGASAVIGHHPHVLQGIEWYGGRPILYSLGNFVFTPASGRLGETGVLDLFFDGARPVEVRFHPARIVGGNPRPLTGDAARQLSQRLASLSRGLGTSGMSVGRDGVLRVRKP